MTLYEIRPGELDVEAMRGCWRGDYAEYRVAADARSQIEAAERVVQHVISQRQIVYGVNTGFGLLANQRIAAEELAQLQVNLLLSHSTGTGEPLEDDLVRLILLVKINSLARGYSGVRPLVIEHLIRLLNAGCYPIVPSQGSVGASGDLAPLAHLASTLIGVGEVRWNGQRMPSAAALEKLKLPPLALAPKEGLALLNGTQVSTAMALVGWFKTADLFAAAMVAGAMSTDASMGSDTPFDPRIQTIRLHQGQSDCAATYRHLLKGSAIRKSHESMDVCDKVQDPYSLRCQPQVMGACLEYIRFVAHRLQCEANAVSDNPLVFAGEGDILSGGNFHGEPVAMAADTLALAIAEVGALSERRIALLMDQHLSGLPPFLVTESGLNSGFMMAQVTAAALASENKSLAHPASVDSLPTSANQEDHVSMATFAARRLNRMAENSTAIVAIELLAAAQGLDFRQPLMTSTTLQAAQQAIRQRVPFYDTDRWFHPDIQQIKDLIASGWFHDPRLAVPSLAPSLTHAVS